MSLRKFLSQYSVIKSNPKDKPTYTHTGLGPYAGLYNIPLDKRAELHEMIIQSVYDKKSPVHITEKPSEIKPITIDIDFRYPQDYAVRQHTEKHIEKLVELYNKSIRKYVDVPNDKIIRSFVFERNGPYPFKGNFKDGIHIIYPEVVTNVNIQHMIRKDVLKTCRPYVFSNKEIGELPLKNSPEDIIDEAVIARNCWLMYGCSKPQYEKYNLTHIYDDLYYDEKFMLKEITSHNYSNLDLINLLSIQREDNKERELSVREEFKPQILKLLEDTKNKKTKRHQADNRAYISNRKPKNVNREKAKKNYEEAVALVKILGSYRAHNYQLWMEVGWCLYNISHSLLDSWIEFSKQSHKFREGECEEKWSTFDEKALGIGSLHRWAKLDNLEEYNQLKSTFLQEYIFRSLSGTDQDVAKVIHKMFEHQYKCVHPKGNMWYEFRNHRWHECKEGITLKQKIGNEVLNEYLHLVAYYNISATNVDNDEKNIILGKAKGLTELTYKLRDSGFKKKLMSECILQFYDPNFIIKLDANPLLMGFENGVYDMKEGAFRNGRPEDYVSLSTNNDYPDVAYDPHDPIIEEIIEFFSQIFPDEELREYALVLFASFLQGTNPDEKFHIFTGVGGNGKSKLIELFESAIGDYSFKFPIQLLCGKRGASGAANPEVARTKGKRFGVFQEPDEGDKLNVGYMKELTGGDSILVRGLYSDPFEFKPQFKLVLCCNHKPKIPSDDEGTWRRMSVLDFMSKFTHTPDPANRYEFPRDDHLTQKLMRWKEMFLVVLFHYYKQYKANKKLVEPDMVKNATLEYQKDSDIYAQFRDDLLVKDNESTLKVEESYIKFKAWYSENLNSRPPTRREFKTNLERKLSAKYGRGSRAGWAGWRLISLDDDIDESLTQDQTNPRTSIMRNPTPKKIMVTATPKKSISLVKKSME